VAGDGLCGYVIAAGRIYSEISDTGRGFAAGRSHVWQFSSFREAIVEYPTHRHPDLQFASK
jgi:hypothetical protein